MQITLDLQLPEGAIGGPGHAVASLASMSAHGVILIAYASGVVALTHMPLRSSLQRLDADTETMILEEHAIKSIVLCARPTRTATAWSSGGVLTVSDSGSDPCAVASWSHASVERLLRGSDSAVAFANPPSLPYDNQSADNASHSNLSLQRTHPPCLFALPCLRFPVCASLWLHFPVVG